MEKIVINQKAFFLILCFLTFIVFCFGAYSQREKIFQKFNYKTWEDKYNKSQWIVPNSKNEISDEDLFIYQGYKLVNGHDPSLLSAEVPPLGKYMIGFFEIVTSYTGIYGLIFSAVSLILFFVLNRIIFKSELVAIVPVFLFSLDRLFRDQIGISLLDTAYLSFLLLTFILFLKKKYILAGISAGLFMATKSPFIVAVLLLTLVSVLHIKHSLDLKKVIVLPAATFLTYMAIHLQYFILGHGFLDFLRVQKYMINFYQTGAKGAVGAIFPLIFSGFWITWFGKNMFIKEWSLIWPLAFMGSILAGYRMLKGRILDEGLLLIGIWLGLYTVFLLFVPLFPRYLLLALPFMYNLAIWALLKTIRPHLLRH